MPVLLQGERSGRMMAIPCAACERLRESGGEAGCDLPNGEADAWQLPVPDELLRPAPWPEAGNVAGNGQFCF